jgi:general secretion pathway protein D
METFGTVNAISNPKLTVMNNQPALFKVAQNEVFFTLSLERILSDKNRPDIETTTSRMQTVPIGLIMSVQPSINRATGKVTLLIRPTISRVVEKRKDPAVSIQSQERVSSEVPVVQVREFESVVEVDPGQVLVLGGLIEKTSQSTAYGPGGLRETWLGRLLGGKQEQTVLSELVIFLTVRLQPRAQESELKRYNGL